MNYSPEQTKYIINEWLAVPVRETVNRLAKELKKPVKSIIGKLSREGVYRREVYKTKTGEVPITKLELVEDIAVMLEEDSENLIGLDKTPKIVLKRIVNRLKNLKEIIEK